MRVELADVISSENMEMSKEVEIELLSFDSRLGQFPVVKKTPFVMQLPMYKTDVCWFRGRQKLQLQYRAAAAWKRWRGNSLL